MADDAGALLVRAGLISSHHLAAARALQAADGGTVGEHLVEIGAVTDEALTEFYRSRLMVPQVNPNTLARLANTVVSVLPGDMAVEFRAVPVSLDKDGNLMVAMSDPSDRHAVDEIAFFTGKYVVRAVATQMQIAWCLAQYYGHVTELGERLLQPAPSENGKSSGPAPSAAPKPLPRARGDTAKVEASRRRVMAPVTSPPPIASRPVPEPAPAPAPPPKVPTPSELAAAEAEAPIEMEMLVDDPSGPVRLPSDMPAGVLAAASASVAAATAASSAASQAAEDAIAEQPPGVEGGSPSIIISREATTPKRKRPALPDPPELAARSGEMESHQFRELLDQPSATVEIHLEDDEPAVVIAPPPPPVVIEDSSGSGSTPRPISDNDRADTEDEEEESQPILLDRPRSSPAIVVAPATEEDTAPSVISAPAPVQDEPSGPVLLLERKKSPTARRDKRTQLGIGVFAATLGPIPRSPETDAAAAVAASAAASAAAAAAASIAASAAAGPAPAEAIPSILHDDDNAKTRRHATSTTPSAVDDGWGPPGTTIPPPFLGAVVPADDPASGRIPLPGDGADSAPLVLTQPRATPEPSKRNTAAPIDAAEQARALEAAAIKLVEILRSFDNASSRDHVIAMLVDFVADSHHRVAFLAAKPGMLHAFMQNPPPGGPQATLPLSAPSVFQDVVGTRLPYRGPISDPVSREFVRALFGSTTDEMLAVPVAVRERVVGVIYADGRQRRAFDEHVAVAARAAGMALERLLKTKKS